MSSRAIEEKKSKRRTEEAFDFPDTSDLCDFGYVLADQADRPTTPQSPHSKPSS